jgi:hypothetical protein
MLANNLGGDCRGGSSGGQSGPESAVRGAPKGGVGPGCCAGLWGALANDRQRVAGVRIQGQEGWRGQERRPEEPENLRN